MCCMCGNVRGTIELIIIKECAKVRENDLTREYTNKNGLALE